MFHCLNRNDRVSLTGKSLRVQRNVSASLPLRVILTRRRNASACFVNVMEQKGIRQRKVKGPAIGYYARVDCLFQLFKPKLELIISLNLLLA